MALVLAGHEPWFLLGRLTWQASKNQACGKGNSVRLAGAQRAFGLDEAMYIWMLDIVGASVSEVHVVVVVVGHPWTRHAKVDAGAYFGSGHAAARVRDDA